jgi:hypothetical protein
MKWMKSCDNMNNADDIPPIYSNTMFPQSLQSSTVQSQNKKSTYITFLQTMSHLLASCFVLDHLFGFVHFPTH